MKSLKNINWYSNPKNKTFFIETLGCPKNEVISEKIAYLLKKKFSITQIPEKADFILINSCGFIESALSETIETVISYSNKFKNKKIILTGCAVQIFQNELKKELKEADYIINYNELNDILLNSNFEQAGRYKLFKRVYTYIRISEGCSQNCTYCIIPRIKGKFRPFPDNLIMQEIKNLKNENYKEAIIVSQDTLSFGINNLKKIINFISQNGFSWIRLMYFNPDMFTENTFELFNLKNVIKYIEIPIQHTEDKILHLMGRKADFNQIEKIINELKKRYPEIIIRTTIIIGFPSETKKDFENLKSKILKLPFDYVGIFPYSDMEKAASYRLNGKINNNEILKRYNELSELLIDKANFNFAKFYNKSYDFLIENIDKEKNQLIGRIYAQAPEIDGLTTIKPKNSINNYYVGEFIKIKIFDNILFDLYGEEI